MGKSLDNVGSLDSRAVDSRAEEQEHRYRYTIDDSGRLCRVDNWTGNVGVAKGTLPDLLTSDEHFVDEQTFIRSSHRTWKYHPIYRDTIVDYISAGLSLSKICKMPGMPSLAVISRWRRHHDDFEEAVMHARAMRAEVMADELMDEERICADDPLASKKVEINKYNLSKIKFLTEKNDPDRYGNRTKVVGDKNAPIAITVDTGIDDTPSLSSAADSRPEVEEDSVEAVEDIELSKGEDYGDAEEGTD